VCFSAPSSAPCSRFYSLDMDFSVISPWFDVALLLHLPPSCLAPHPARSLAPRCLGFPLSSSVLTRSVELCIIITPHLISSCPRPGSWFAFRVFFVFSFSFFFLFSRLICRCLSRHYLSSLFSPSKFAACQLIISPPYLHFSSFVSIAPSHHRTPSAVIRSGSNEDEDKDDA